MPIKKAWRDWITSFKNNKIVPKILNIVLFPLVFIILVILHLDDSRTNAASEYFKKGK